jgi:hypothetical protein
MSLREEKKKLREERKGSTRKEAAQMKEDQGGAENLPPKFPSSSWTRKALP